MPLQAVFSLFTLLFVFFSVPVGVKVLAGEKVFVNLFKRLIVIMFLSSLFLLFQFLSTVFTGNKKVVFTGLKFICAGWIIPFYISFLSQLSFRKIPKSVIFLFGLIPLAYTALFITGHIKLGLLGSGYSYNSLFEIFIIAFTLVFDLGAISLGVEIFIFKSKRPLSLLIFILIFLTCIGISLDNMFFLSNKSLNSLFLPLSLMLVYLILSYKLIFKFINVYDQMSQNINLKNDIEAALSENQGLLSDDLQDRDDVAVAQIKISPSGGDFYVYHQTDDDNDCVVIGNINLYGVQGAFYSTMSRSYLNVFLHRGLSPAEILRSASHFLCNNKSENPDISMFVCKRDREKREITLSSAGHPNQLIYNSRMEKTLPVKLGGKKINCTNEQDFEEKTYKFMPDDLLILFSEGFIKAFDSDIDRFDVDSIHDILKRKSLKNPQRIVKTIIGEIKDINNFGKITEDVSVMVIKLG